MSWKFYKFLTKEKSRIKKAIDEFNKQDVYTADQVEYGVKLEFNLKDIEERLFHLRSCKRSLANDKGVK